MLALVEIEFLRHFQDSTCLLSEEGSESPRSSKLAMRRYICDESIKRSSGEALRANMDFEVENWSHQLEEPDQSFQDLLNGLYGLNATKQWLPVTEARRFMNECFHHLNDLLNLGDLKEMQKRLPVVFSALSLIYYLIETPFDNRTMKSPPSGSPTPPISEETQLSLEFIPRVPNDDLLGWISCCDDALCAASLDWFFLEYQYTTHEPLDCDILCKRWETCRLHLVQGETNFPSLRNLIITTHHWAYFGTSKYNANDYTHLINRLVEITHIVPNFETSPIASYTLRALCELWYIRSQAFEPSSKILNQHRETLVQLALGCLHRRFPVITERDTERNAIFDLPSEDSTYACTWSLRLLATVSCLDGNQNELNESVIDCCMPHWGIIVQCATPISLLQHHRLLVCSSIKAISSLVQTGIEFDSRNELLSVTKLPQTLVYLHYLDLICSFLSFKSSSEQLLSILSSIPGQSFNQVVQEVNCPSASIPAEFLSILLPFADSPQSPGLERDAYEEILSAISRHASLLEENHLPVNLEPDYFWTKCAMRDTSFRYERYYTDAEIFAVRFFQLCRIGICGRTALGICDIVCNSKYDMWGTQDSLAIAFGIVHYAVFPGELIEFPVILSQFLYPDIPRDGQELESWRSRVKSVLASDFLELMDSFQLSRNVDLVRGDDIDSQCSSVVDMDPNFFMFCWLETARSLIRQVPQSPQNGYVEFDWDGNTKTARFINGWPGSQEDEPNVLISEDRSSPDSDQLLKAVKTHLKVSNNHVLLFHVCSASELVEGGMTLGSVCGGSHDFGMCHLRYFHFRFSDAVDWAMQQMYPEPVILCFAIDVEKHKEAMQAKMDCVLFQLPNNNPSTTLDPWTACIIASRLRRYDYFGGLGVKLGSKQSLAGPIASSFPPYQKAVTFKVSPCRSPGASGNYDPQFNTETRVELPSNSFYECLTNVSIANDVPPFQIAIGEDHLKRFVRTSDVVCIYFPRTTIPEKRLLHTVYIR